MTPTKTADGRYLIIDGRRWRATDPALSDDLVRELRSELGRARSRIRHSQSDAELRALRDRVQLAKEGLGERSTPWWEMSTEDRLARANDRLARLRNRPHEE